MELNKAFSHNYEVQQLTELSSNAPVFYYPGGTLAGGKDGVILKITPLGGESLIAIFAFGDLTNKGFFGLYSMPDPNSICVVSNGTGYIVNTINPSIWKKVECIPVKDVRPISASSIILFSDYTDLIAYNHNGIKWTFKDIALDGFEIINITDKLIIGSYYDIRFEENKNFHLDISTGIMM